MKTIKYKNYEGSIEYNEESKTWHGKVVDDNEVLTYSADTEEELRAVFKELISDLIGEWEANGETFYKNW